MIKTVRARNGEPSLQVAGRALHSLFDPTREATRFVDSLEIGTPRTILLLGAGIGFVQHALAKRYPQAELVCVYLNAHIRTHAEGNGTPSGKEWAPGDDESLADFLFRAIPELQTLAIAVVEWRSGMAFAPETAVSLREEITAYVRRAQGSVLSAGAQGPSRVRNSIINLSKLPHHQFNPALTRGVKAVAVVASGPTIEQSLYEICRVRDELLVISTGSAIAALERASCRPDFIVVTESSIYSSLHLHFLSAPEFSRIPLIVPASVSTSVAALGNPCVLFAQDELIDAALIDQTAFRIPQFGSVTLSAIAVARSITSAPIAVLGLDLGWRDGRSHARPHLAHSWRLNTASRICPGASQQFVSTRSHSQVADGWTQDRSLLTYADWIRQGGLSSLGLLHALSPSPILGPLIPEITVKQLDGLTELHTAPTSVTPLQAVSSPQDRVGELLDRFMAQIESISLTKPPEGQQLSLLSALAIRPLMSWAKSPDSPSAGKAAISEALVQLRSFKTLVDHVRT